MSVPSRSSTTIRPRARSTQHSAAREAHQTAGALTLEERCEQHAAAAREHEVRADHLVEAVVGTLDEHVGLERTDELERRVLAEDDERIDELERGQHARARELALDRAALALQAPDRFVGIESDDQPVGAAPRLIEQRDVPRMQQVEAAVGEGDARTLLAPGTHQ